MVTSSGEQFVSRLLQGENTRLANSLFNFCGYLSILYRSWRVYTHIYQK